MKEAIKVQSVTIIIINGISESFQSVRWLRQKTAAIPAPGVGFLLGKNKAKESACGRHADAATRGSSRCALSNRAAGGKITDARRGQRSASLPGQGEVNAGPDLGLGIKAKWIPGWWFLLCGSALQGLPQSLALSLLHQQCSHPMPGPQAGPRVQTRKDTVLVEQEAQSRVGKTGTCLSFSAEKGGAARTRGKQSDGG